MKRPHKGQVWKPPTVAEQSAVANAVETSRRGNVSPKLPSQLPSGDIIYVDNQSSTNRLRGQILALTQSIALSAVSQNYIWLSAEDTSESFPYRRFHERRA